MRDPLVDTKMSARKAVLVSAAVVAATLVFAIARPSAFWTVAVLASFLLMIVLHELGHFSTAKLTGMKASEFFVGFGPRLWSTRRGETEYGVKAVPLGGYVKILGMTNVEDVPPEDEPCTYRSKSYGSKVLVASAGSAMHFMIALVLMFVVLLFAGDLPNRYPVPVVDAVAFSGDDESEPGPAAAAGLLPGDEVLEVDGVQIDTWDDLVDTVAARPGETVDFVVDRGGETLDIEVDLASEHPVSGEQQGYAGIAPSSEVPPTNVLSAAGKAPGEVWNIGYQSIVALGDIFSPSGLIEYTETITGENEGTPEENQRFISPVGFGRVANQAVNSGWVAALGLLIAINVFVGIFNLAPLLPFDGGHIAIATYEAIATKVRGRKVVVDVNKLMPLTAAVVAILGFIFLSSLFLDISRPVDNPF